MAFSLVVCTATAADAAALVADMLDSLTKLFFFRSLLLCTFHSLVRRVVIVVIVVGGYTFSHSFSFSTSFFIHSDSSIL